MTITSFTDEISRLIDLIFFRIECGAGVHFRSSVENAGQYAPKIGDMVYGLIQRRLNGG